MSTKPAIGSGEIDISSLQPKSRRDADREREIAEREALEKFDGRSLRRRGRTETFSTKLRPQTIALIRSMAIATGKSMVEVIEEALEAYDMQLKGKK
jgi:hypothetical protein